MQGYLVGPIFKHDQRFQPVLRTLERKIQMSDKESRGEWKISSKPLGLARYRVKGMRSYSPDHVSLALSCYSANKDLPLSFLSKLYTGSNPLLMTSDCVPFSHSSTATATCTMSELKHKKSNS